MESQIRTIIVDDELLACRRLEKLLKEDKEIDITAVCKNGVEAIEQIHEKNPDLLFLDIQMPEINGFEVLQHIETDLMPATIFVTAYNEYALKAFEVHALDYLMKPFSKSRFNEALGRVKNIIAREAQSNIDEKVDQLLKFVHNDEPLSRILVKSSDHYSFLKSEDIVWIEAAGNYVRIHTSSKKHLIRETMTNMVEKLDSNLFFRIHRSTIVNVEKVKELEKWFHGDYKVVMDNGEKLTMSRNYKELLDRFS
ncbi:LytR/AlgR family response regulator transcription factor [Fodinibius salsisoli]|uniref:Response regulator transcription factor n=1 Tax=Fodinibius salsisoli TaxID=2820877 RepID=A0ABT3PJ62_9BACT|nr:LytTR family DNA-binding domain-containing protein [Fodinibius salsisoli]MCW9705976.1 response regulator transcription factor [Fodinibius salsisoli]